MKRKTLKKSVVSTVNIIAFVGLIFGFSIWNALAPKKTVSWNENRTLASPPSLSIQHILSGRFDDDFETWFSDHFVNRDFWIELKSLTRRASLCIENNEIYFARGERLVSRFASFRQETLDANIDRIQEFAAENHVQANVLLVPSAVWGAKADLPFGAQDINQDALLKEIQGKLSDQKWIPITDTMTKDPGNYFRTDHHWNEKGAYLGYEAICREVLGRQPQKFVTECVNENFSGTMYSKSGAFWTKPDRIYRILPEKPFTASVSFDDGKTLNSLYSEERLQEKDKYTFYIDGNHALTSIHTSNENHRKALIIKDSYSHILMPYLAAEYEELTLVDLRYYHQPVSGLMDETTDLYFIYSLDNFAEDPSLAFLR